MNNSRKSIIEKIVFNNKALMVFSVIVAVIIWATVKINYSEEISRTLTDVKINIVSCNHCIAQRVGRYKMNVSGTFLFFFKGFFKFLC